MLFTKTKGQATVDHRASEKALDILEAGKNCWVTIFDKPQASAFIRDLLSLRREREGKEATQVGTLFLPGKGILYGNRSPKYDEHVETIENFADDPSGIIILKSMRNRRLRGSGSPEVIEALAQIAGSDIGPKIMHITSDKWSKSPMAEGADYTPGQPENLWRHFGAGILLEPQGYSLASVPKPPQAKRAAESPVEDIFEVPDSSYLRIGY